ncbi:bacterioferritin [Hansschlegelia plantiphila]|uniref:Bacterioferritin n=1 Tax=Hansschlegelia plantiphila TaxID=374655 RepID=A0A9W6IY70_9HYPH|nr:bacterioferritin [Hansschlegelia plantiphila]GLK67202.1 bacterioferritin [Hansschlegelia plantiphila]
MKGDAKVIEFLNRGLRSELTAINQYWLHYRMLDDWGYKDLAKQWRKESIEEMNHADRFVTRIIFLDGFPNLQVLDPLRIGQSVKEVLECDLAAELDARALYREAALYCQEVGDLPSKILFESLMTDEEGHIDFLETQLDLVAKLGEQLYAQRHIGHPEGGGTGVEGVA